MSDQTGSDQSSSLPGTGGRGSWPVSRCGVAPGFRNFCITNEHPDGIVFELQNGAEDPLPAESTSPPNATEAPEEVEIPQPQSLRRGSSSSSIMSCSPCASPAFSSLPSSPCSSSTVFSDVSGTIIISSSSSDTDDDDDDDAMSVDLSQEKEKQDKFVGNENGKSDDKDKETENMTKGNDAETSTRVETTPIAAFPSTSTSPNVTISSGKKGGSLPPQANSGTSTPPLLYHKKFHYKSRTAAARTTSVEVSQESPPTEGGLKRQLEKSKDNTKLGHEKPQRPPNVEDLKLSPYITREQAAARLLSLDSLEATQREIDNFSAIIRSGTMFRVQLHANNANATNGSNGATLNAQRNPVRSKDSSVEKNVAQQNASGKQAASPSSSSIPVIRPPPTGQSLFVSSTASVSLGSGGDVISSQPCYSSSAGMNNMQYDSDDDRIQNVERQQGVGSAGGGGYFMVTSPGQASTSDDYEWISD